MTIISVNMWIVIIMDDNKDEDRINRYDKMIWMHANEGEIKIRILRIPNDDFDDDGVDGANDDDHHHWLAK